MRLRKTYYTAFALRDGTICAVLETRKPRKHRYSRTPKIDADGIHSWLRYNFRRPIDFPDLQRVTWSSSIANCLNTKRIIRLKVEKRLDGIEKLLHSLVVRLDRLEQALARFPTDPSSS